MQAKIFRLLAAAGAMALMVPTTPASALTMKECSAKYKEAQKAGTLGGKKWNDFRKSDCGADATPATPASTTAAPAEPAATPAPRARTRAPSAPASADVGNAVFPSAVASKYASEKPGKARMKTCVDQYNANKASNANGGLKWIQKGGGYYSECNKRLKGEA